MSKTFRAERTGRKMSKDRDEARYDDVRQAPKRGHQNRRFDKHAMRAEMVAMMAVQGTRWA